MPRRAFAPRVNALLRQLLKRLALDRERGVQPQREMRQPHIGKAATG